MRASQKKSGAKLGSINKMEHSASSRDLVVQQLGNTHKIPTSTEQVDASMEESMNPNKKRDLKPSPEKVQQSSRTQDNDSGATPTHTDEVVQGTVPTGDKDTVTPPQTNTNIPKVTISLPTSFKPFNNRSKNRRECKRVTGLSDAQDHSDMTQNHQNNDYTRATLKLNLPATDNPTVALIQLLKDFLRELHESDEDITLIPWKTANFNNAPISSVQQVPTTLTKLKNTLNACIFQNPVRPQFCTRAFTLATHMISLTSKKTSNYGLISTITDFSIICYKWKIPGRWVGCYIPPVKWMQVLLLTKLLKTLELK